jgi:hypothetical protein
MLKMWVLVAFTDNKQGLSVKLYGQFSIMSVKYFVRKNNVFCCLLKQVTLQGKIVYFFFNSMLINSVNIIFDRLRRCYRRRPRSPTDRGVLNSTSVSYKLKSQKNVFALYSIMQIILERLKNWKKRFLDFYFYFLVFVL